VTPRDEPRDDPRGMHDGPETARLVGALQAWYTSSTIAPDARASLRRTLSTQAVAHRRVDQPRRTPYMWPRLVALVALVLSAIGATAVYEATRPPMVASVQAVLNRAVGALPPDAAAQVIHQTFSAQTTMTQTTASGDAPSTVRMSAIDVWSQVAADGTIVRYDGYARSITGTLLLRELRNGPILTVVDWIHGQPSVHRTTAPTPPRAAPFSAGMDWGQPLRDAQAAPGQAKRLLPRQTLDGHTVDVVQLERADTTDHQVTTLYIDARSYLLREVDTSETLQTDSADPHALQVSHHTTRLVGYERLPLSAVPSSVFQPPAGGISAVQQRAILPGTARRPRTWAHVNGPESDSLP